VADCVISGYVDHRFGTRGAPGKVAGMLGGTLAPENSIETSNRLRKGYFALAAAESMSVIGGACQT
jgi:hypothetical protein